MKPTRLSAQVFLELPPVLAHYLQGGRNLWLESLPSEGKLSLLNRTGVFTDLEGLAVQRRQLMELLGLRRARALNYRMGFEQGRRDAARHFSVFGQNARLALQAGPVFGQLQGRFVFEAVRFEFDLEARTLFRELLLHQCVEAATHRMVTDQADGPVCWFTAGYLSGHVSEILGRRIVTMETSCAALGAAACRFVSRLDPEWGAEAEWVRDALRMPSVEEEMAKRDEMLAEAQKNARSAKSALTTLSKRVHIEPTLDYLVADSEGMQAAVNRARQVARSDVPVLLVGEPGCGREAFARGIHLEGARKNGPFQRLDCVGLHETLQTQELLGFAQGAFVGATHDHPGALARAHKGTLYVADVTQLSLDAQGRLFNAMKDGSVSPLGGDPVRTDTRIVAAAPQDPLELVKQGAFREDLYYALSVGRIDLPALRDRGADILRLAERFLQDFRERYEKPGLELGKEVKQTLLDSAWPGNVRQLRNVIEHAVVFGRDGEITPSDLPQDVLATEWRRAPRELTEDVVRAALGRCRGNRTHAADLLGVGRTTLWRAMKRFGLE